MSSTASEDAWWSHILWSRTAWVTVTFTTFFLDSCLLCIGVIGDMWHQPLSLTQENREFFVRLNKCERVNITIQKHPPWGVLPNESVAGPGSCWESTEVPISRALRSKWISLVCFQYSSKPDTCSGGTGVGTLKSQLSQFSILNLTAATLAILQLVRL